MSLIKNENCSRFTLALVPAYLSVFPCAAEQNLTSSGYAEIAQAHHADLLQEFRAEYAMTYFTNNFKSSICAEIFIDAVLDEKTPDWCELYIGFANEHVELTLGRQTLNWGLGQYFYVNDPFAKDWQSIAIGRDKGDIDDVNDGLHLTLYNLFAADIQLDWVWAKSFMPNSYADIGRIKVTEQQNLQLAADTPNKSEHMLRISQQAKGLTWALFYHQGYQKQAQPLAQGYQHHQLKHLGMSISSHFELGEVGLEIGHTDVEQTSKHTQYLLVFEPKFLPHSSQHFLRLQWLKNDTLNWLGMEYHYQLDEQQTIAVTNLFATEKMSAMLMAHYNLTFYQMWTWELGVNLFKGDDAGAQWDYFADSSNLYTRLRFNF
ncbi:hypothetical protein ACMZOO_05530 [Catenovulum sp. SX2]|uniref:hypothetical protein n=1 Tax=Catenovulum sp. SX2 TaxID=3398614 RepID=UPI003F82AF10